LHRQGEQGQQGIEIGLAATTSKSISEKQSQSPRAREP